MEDKDIKIIEELIKNANIEDMDMNDCFGGEHIESLEKLLQAYKQDEKVIEEMVKVMIDSQICDYFVKNKCVYYAGENKKTCDSCIIDYFRNKCE